MAFDVVYAHGVQSRSRMIAVDFVYAHVVQSRFRMIVVEFVYAHVVQSRSRMVADRPYKSTLCYPSSLVPVEIEKELCMESRRLRVAACV